MFFRDRDDVGDMIAVAVGEQDVVDLVREHKAFRVFGIALDERIDQDVGALGGLDQHGCVAQPGDTGSLQ